MQIVVRKTENQRHKCKMPAFLFGKIFYGGYYGKKSR